MAYVNKFIILTLFILAKLSSFHLILGTVSIVGSIFLAYLAYESIRIKGIDLKSQKIKTNSIKKGVVVNFLNPNVYLFWFTVGAPTILEAYQISLWSSIIFILGFYVFLIGSGIILVLLVEKSKSFLKSKSYIYTIRILGMVMLVFAIIFIRKGLELFGVF